MFNQDKYLSAVWQKGGRAFPKIDCYGLVLEIRRDIGLIDWPEFTGVTKDNRGLDDATKRFNHKLTRCQPEAGAVVECFTGSIVTHLAVVVEMDGGLFVAECNPKSNVTFMVLEQFKRRFVKVEFWK
ncbi:TPA: nitrite transporter [Klebsiella michiganensis]